VGIITDVADNLNVVEEINANATPVFGFAYDYLIDSKISFGAVFAYQAIRVGYEDYTYEEDDNLLVDDFYTELTRLNFSVRALYLYNPTQTLHFYSGLRLGLSNWSADTNVADVNYDPDPLINVALEAGFAPQLILLGTDFELARHWSLGGELAIGAPYFISAGLRYSW
jgi:hypothetical protein